VKASNPDYSILPYNTEVEQVIELQELVGAACVFYSNSRVLRTGFQS
jgi:hypothetical protein